MDEAVGPKMQSMHGLVPHGKGSSRIVCNSMIVGSRQSQCPAKHAVMVVPSPLVWSFRVARKTENAVPSGAVPVADQR